MFMSFLHDNICMKRSNILFFSLWVCRSMIRRCSLGCSLRDENCSVDWIISSPSLNWHDILELTLNLAFEPKRTPFSYRSKFSRSRSSVFSKVTAVVQNAVVARKCMEGTLSRIWVLFLTEEGVWTQCSPNWVSVWKGISFPGRQCSILQRHLSLEIFLGGYLYKSKVKMIT